MHQQRGFTLIETVIFIMVLGIALTGIISLFVQSAIGGRYPYDQQRAMALANTYMDEILRKRWDENTPLDGGCVETGSNYCNTYCATRTFPACGTCVTGAGVCTAPIAAGLGAEVGESRATFDDVDDYLNLPDTVPRDTAGTAIAGYAVYSIGVTVTTTPGTPWNSVNGADAKQIVVTVSKGTESYSLIAYKVNY